VEIFSCVAGSGHGLRHLDERAWPPHTLRAWRARAQLLPDADVDEIRSRILSSTVPIASLTAGPSPADASTPTTPSRSRATGCSRSAWIALRLDPAQWIGPAHHREGARPFAIRDATVTGRVVDGPVLTFRNDGQAPDTTANDANYSARLTVPLTGDTLSLLLTMAAPDKVAARIR